MGSPNEAVVRPPACGLEVGVLSLAECHGDNSQDGMLGSTAAIIATSGLIEPMPCYKALSWGPSWCGGGQRCNGTGSVNRGLEKQTDPKSFDSSVVRTAYTSTDFYH